eukprot:scaffold1599_cov115-Cylindrotheca_fusiformis.AAC.5
MGSLSDFQKKILTEEPSSDVEDNAISSDDSFDKFDDCMMDPIDEPSDSINGSLGDKGMALSEESLCRMSGIAVTNGDIDEALRPGRFRKEEKLSRSTSFTETIGTGNGPTQGDADENGDLQADKTELISDRVAKHDSDDSSVSTFFSTDQSFELTPSSPAVKHVASGSFQKIDAPPVSDLVSVPLDNHSVSSLEDLECGTKSTEEPNSTYIRHRSLELLSYDDSDDDDDELQRRLGTLARKKDRQPGEVVKPCLVEHLSAGSTEDSDSDWGHVKFHIFIDSLDSKKQKRLKYAVVLMMIILGCISFCCAIVYGLKRVRHRGPIGPDPDALFAALGFQVSSAPSEALPNAVSTHIPTGAPSFLAPTERPSPTQSPTPDGPSVARFYVIGDLPYNEREKERLIEHVANLPGDADFLVHVGDIRNAENSTDCLVSEFEMVGDILKQSTVPVLIVPGDNEYNDCPNLAESWDHWLSVFDKLESHWDSSLKIARDNVRPENFYFVHQRMLYIGLNIVGGVRHDKDEWESRLTHDFEWTKELIETHILRSSNNAEGVVLFAHADPKKTIHAPFFDPLQGYIANELNNTIPIIYMNGDLHYFQFDSDFYGQPSFHRIMVEGGSFEPPLQMTVTIPKHRADGETLLVQDIYEYNRYPEIE